MNRFLLPIGAFALLVVVLAIGIQRAPEKSVIKSVLLDKPAPQFVLPQLGSAVSFDVLMLGSDEGVKIGTPTVSGAKVEGKVVSQVKGEKIIIYKYKSKKNYHRKAGHRQNYTKVEITAVG